MSKKAFEQIFRSNYASLFSLGYRMSFDKELTKDVIQGLFLELWEKRDRLGEVNYWNAYLRKSFQRKMVLELKRLHKQTSFTEHTKVDASPSYETLLVEFQNKEHTKSALQTAIAQLPDQERKVLEQRFFEGMSYDEIASFSNRSKQTVYNQVFSAIKKLRKSLL